MVGWFPRGFQPPKNKHSPAKAMNFQWRAVSFFHCTPHGGNGITWRVFGISIQLWLVGFNDFLDFHVGKIRGKLCSWVALRCQWVIGMVTTATIGGSDEVLPMLHHWNPGRCAHGQASGWNEGWGHGRKMPNWVFGLVIWTDGFVVSISRNSWRHNDDNFIHSKPLQHYYDTRFLT